MVRNVYKFAAAWENETVVFGAGHVLAAWLVSGRGLPNSAAIAAVRKTGRNPYEAAIAAVIRGRNPLKAFGELNTLLNNCRLTV